MERLRIILYIFIILHIWRDHIIYPIGIIKYRRNDNIIKLRIYFWIGDLSRDNSIDIF
jgi:hypothetical protein